MTWTITGNSDGLLLSVTKHGSLVIRGVGSHVPYFPDDPAGPASRSDYTAIQNALRRLQTVQTDWRIVSAADARKEFGPLHSDLVARMERCPTEPIVEISCIDREEAKEPALSFVVVLGPPVFQKVHELLAGLLTGPREVQYIIAVGFLTFRYPGAVVDIPTLEEFLAGVPYFSDEVSVSVRRVSRNE